MDKRKEQEGDKIGIPGHVQVFDPDNRPYQTLHLCIYLRELEEEKENKELSREAESALHK